MRCEDCKKDVHILIGYDWIGDPDVVNGTQEIVIWYCAECGGTNLNGEQAKAKLMIRDRVRGTVRTQEIDLLDYWTFHTEMNFGLLTPGIDVMAVIPEGYDGPQPPTGWQSGYAIAKWLKEVEGANRQGADPD